MANPKFEGFAVPTAEPNATLCNSLPDTSAESTREPSSVIVPAATPIRQKRKPYMSKRFQTGSVQLVGKMWHGRYWRGPPRKKKRGDPVVLFSDKTKKTKTGNKKKNVGNQAKERVK